MEDECSWIRGGCLSIECGDAWEDLMRGQLQAEVNRSTNAGESLIHTFEELLYDSTFARITRHRGGLD